MEVSEAIRRDVRLSLYGYEYAHKSPTTPSVVAGEEGETRRHQIV